MQVFPYEQVKAEIAGEKGAHKVKVRWLITKETGAPTFAMRLFEVEPGGHSPLHAHPWEHEIFVLEGRGVLIGENGEIKMSRNHVVFVAPNELHQFRNNSNELFSFLCVVPHKRE